MAELSFLCYNVSRDRAERGAERKRWDTVGRKWLTLLLAAALAVVPAGCGEKEPVWSDPVPLNEYDGAAFSIVDGFLTYDGDAPSYVGVDVSSYQGEIDWSKAAEAGVRFAIIRVGLRGYTEGGLIEDTCWRQNIEGALDAGLKVGVYFFSQAVTEAEAVEEAEFVLERIGNYDVAYPVVFDWERQTAEGSRTAGTDRETMTACTVAFCRRVEEAGYRPMVYFSPSKAYTELELEQLLDWPFWLAHYTPGWAPTSFRYHFAMWQYSCEGQVDGIEGLVDLDLCLTDFEAEKATAETGEPSAAPQETDG